MDVCNRKMLDHCKVYFVSNTPYITLVYRIEASYFFSLNLTNARHVLSYD